MADGMTDDAQILVLRKPIVLKDRTITEITIREPSAGELAMAENTGKKGQTDQGIILLGLASGLHPDIIKQLGGGDFLKAQKVLGNFFVDGQETGENLSQS